MAPAAVRKQLHLTLSFCCQWKREQDFDLQLLDRAVHGERKDKEENGWLKVQAMPVTELDLELQDYDLDISREVRAGSSFVLPQEAWPSGSQPDPPSPWHWGCCPQWGRGSTSMWPRRQDGEQHEAMRGAQCFDPKFKSLSLCKSFNFSVPQFPQW